MDITISLLRACMLYGPRRVKDPVPIHLAAARCIMLWQLHGNDNICFLDGQPAVCFSLEIQEGVVKRDA